MTTTTTTTVLDEATPGFKVFIGNLSFKTNKESLCSFAESTGSKVVEATIITKGTRSLGYGFVTYATEQDMNEAAMKLNHKELDGREINVEVARPKTVTTATESNDNHSKQRKRNTRRKSKTSKKKNTKEVSSSSSDEEEKSSDKKKSSSNKNTKPAISSSSSSDAELPTHRQKKQQSRTKKTRSATTTKKPVASGDRTSSKTTLFVANLPYATTDDDIKKIFADYKVVSAHVTRMNNGRSKGYGFVEFENEEEQQKALSNVKDIVLDNRAVYLKVALSDQHREEDEKVELVTEKTKEINMNDTKK